MQSFTLFDDFITLGQVLKELGLISTGGQAKFFLSEHAAECQLNDQLESRRGKKIYAGDRLSIPSLDLALRFEMASPADIRLAKEEKDEEARVRRLVKQMNQENKISKTRHTSSKKPRSPFKHS